MALLIALMAFLFGIAAITVVFGNHSPSVEWSYIYFTFVMIIVGAFSSLSFRPNPHFGKRLKRRLRTHGLFVFILLLVSGYLRFSKIHDWSLWLDEYSAWGYSMDFGKNYVVGAAIQNQPPLAYLLIAFADDLFGTTEFATRFFFALAGSLLPVCVYFLAYLYFGRRRWLALATAMVVSLNPWMIGYSLENRPYPLGLLYLVVVLYQVRILAPLPLTKNRFYWLMSTVLIFLWSLGLQPFIAVAALATSWSILSFSDKNSRNALKKFTRPFVSAAVISAPIILLSVVYSTAGIRPSPLQAIHRTLEALHYPHIRMDLLILLHRWHWLGWVIFVLAAVSVIVALTGRLRHRQNQQLAFLLMMTLFFLLYQRFVFFGLVQTFDIRRYAILFIPLAILAQFAMVHVISANRSRAWTIWISYGLAIFIFVSAIPNVKLFNDRLAVQRIPQDWRGLFQWFKTRGTSRDFAVLANYGDELAWEPFGLMNQEFYNSEHSPLPFRSRGNWDPVINDAIGHMASDYALNPPAKGIFFVVTDHTPYFYDSIQHYLPEHMYTDSLSVISIKSFYVPVKTDVRSTLRQWHDAILSKMPATSPLRFRLIEALIRFNLIDGRSHENDKLFDQLNDLELNSEQQRRLLFLRSLQSGTESYPLYNPGDST